MNTTAFTTEQLRQAIPRMIAEGRGITANDCGFDPDLIEFDYEDEIEITSADEADGHVAVEFKQSWEGTDDGLDAWTWRYTTVQEVELLKAYLEADELISGCQCLYEIHNKLPRTKFCFVACSAQREARKLFRK